MHAIEESNYTLDYKLVKSLKSTPFEVAIKNGDTVMAKMLLETGKLDKDKLLDYFLSYHNQEVRTWDSLDSKYAKFSYSDFSPEINFLINNGATANKETEKLNSFLNKNNQDQL